MSRNYQDLSDGQLIDKIKGENYDAFAELGARYLWLIRIKAAQFEREASLEREDLCQEGFLGLYLAARSYEKKNGAAFKTYAGVCIQNRMTSAVRTHKSMGNRPLNESVSLETAGDAPAAFWDEPEALVELRESFEGVLLKMKLALSPLERRALSLYLSGFKRREIPEKTGLSLKTFDNALGRVRNKLRSL